MIILISLSWDLSICFFVAQTKKMEIKYECVCKIKRETASDHTVVCFSTNECKCTCAFSKDDIPELAESFLVNITSVELVRGSVGAGQPSVKRPGMEVAEVTILENDDPRGILQLNVSEVSTGSSLG